MGTCVYALLFVCAFASAQAVESEIPMSDAARGGVSNRFPPTPADQIRAMLPIPRAEDDGALQLGAKSPSQILDEVLAGLPSHQDWRNLPLIGRPSRTPFEIYTVNPPPSAAAGLVSAATLRHKVPKDAKKAYDRGLKALQDGEIPRALEQLSKAVALDDEYAAAHANLGVALVRQERLADAEVELRRAIALDPYLSMTHSNLGWVLARLGRAEEALAMAKQALEIDPANQSAKKLLDSLEVR